LNNIGFEIDFIPVGNGSKSGDAIAIRYGYEGHYKIMVIDGGTKESGEKLVDHIKTYYNSDYVDFVVNTHPDGDHASGLSVVLEELQVGELWIHRPWEYSAEIRGLFKDGRITDNSLSERLKEALNNAYALELIALEKGIKIYEPFEGERIGEFIVLSPNKEWYLQELVPSYASTPEAKQESASILDTMKKYGGVLLDKAMEFIDETWDWETLSEEGETTPQNESSVILYADFIDGKVFLTADAGIKALNKAADYAESKGINLLECKFIQVPHHGSRRNVSPSILNRIIGSIVETDSKPIKSAFVSASKMSEKHPRKVVVNAFTRRGVKVFKNNGLTIRHHRNMPEREGWNPITPLPFYQEVEK